MSIHMALGPRPKPTGPWLISYVGVRRLNQASNMGCSSSKEAVAETDHAGVNASVGAPGEPNTTEPGLVAAKDATVKPVNGCPSN